MAKDRFSQHAAGVTAPVADAFVVTPNNDADLREVTRALYIGTGGDVKLRLTGGGEVTYKNVGSGARLPVRAEKVFATGTTASDILGEV